MTQRAKKVFQRAVERYQAPTPLKFKVWGRVILLLGTTMQVALQGMEVHRIWTIMLALVTFAGTALPEFAVLYEPIRESNLPEETTEPKETETL